MIVYGVPATHTGTHATTQERAVAAFLRFLEDKLGITTVRNVRMRPEPPSLDGALQLGALLQARGVIQGFGRNASPPDEPRLYSWFAICNNPTRHQTGGTSWEDDAAALMAALAEALERYIWYTQEDHFDKRCRATTSAIRRSGHHIPPERFAGFSDKQRATHAERELRANAEYLWIRGTSLVSETKTYLPAQIVSGFRRDTTTNEPQIRRATSNGLATWPTRAGARLRGLLEVIERDAYMIMWLNQLTLPRAELATLCMQHPPFAEAVSTCKRYRLIPHVIRLITDAPTHCVATVLEDTSGRAPRFSIGLKAHQSLATAAQKALTEALRARRGYRLLTDKDAAWWKPETPVDEIGHRERIGYWGVPEHAKRLEFLIQGAETSINPTAWDSDDEAAHLQRLVEWCKQRSYECISVPLSTSQANPTPLHIELMVVPELQPAYLTEQSRSFGGSRLQEVPAMFGFSLRTAPFTDAPHPFS